MAFIRWLDDYTSGRVVFDREWDNLLAATAHALTSGDTRHLDRLFAPLQWYSLYMLRFEVAALAVQATALPGAGPATFGAAALLGGFLGHVEDAERFAEAGIAVASDPAAPDTFSCWLGLAAAHASRREPGPIHAAVLGAHESGGLGRFGDALTSAILAAQGVGIDPLVAAEWAARAEPLIADRRNPALTADVLSNLGLYYGLTGDLARGLECCRQAIVLARETEARVSVHTARAWISQLATMGGVDDPAPILRDMIADARRDGVWLHVWMVIAALAGWWAAHGEPHAAAVIVGHLDAHGLGEFGNDTVAATRTEVLSHPGAHEWLASGARLDREDLVTYVLGLGSNTDA
jgi:hypothetical protein